MGMPQVGVCVCVRVSQAQRSDSPLTLKTNSCGHTYARACVCVYISWDLAGPMHVCVCMCVCVCVCLSHKQRRSGTFAEAVMKARVELRDVITIIYANQRQMRRHDPLQKYMEIVFEYAGKQ